MRPALLNVASGTGQRGAVLGIGDVLEDFGDGRILLTVSDELDLPRLETSGCSFGGARASRQD